MILKIHQTSRDANLTSLQKQSADLIKKHNPELKYRLWSDQELEQLAKNSFPQVYAIWNELLGIQKADLGRYMVLYTEGGFYADTDIFTEKSFDDLALDDKNICFAPSTPIWPWEKHTITNYFLYAPITHSTFLSELINASLNRIKLWKGAKDQSYVPKTTGRNMVVEVAKKVEGAQSFKINQVIDLFCATTKIPSSCVVYHAGSTTRPGTTWHKNYTMLIVKLECFLRKSLNIKGNLSQAPVMFIAGAVLILIMIGYLLTLLL